MMTHSPVSGMGYGRMGNLSRETNMDKDSKQVGKPEVLRGARLTAYAVYGLSVLAVACCAGFTYRNWPEPPNEAPDRCPIVIDAREYYPTGWEFLNPTNKNSVNFGLTPPEGEPEANDDLIIEQKTVASTTEPYIVARFPTDLTNTPSEPAAHPRSPLYKIYERNGKADAPTHAPPRQPHQAHKLITPPLRHPEVLPENETVTPSVGTQSKVGEAAEHKALLRHLDSLETEPFSEPLPEPPRHATPTKALAGEHAYLPNGPEILRKFNQHAKNRLEALQEEIHDCYCILYKWDQTNLLSRQRDVMHLLLREEPFSVYVRYEYPEKFRNREFIFWEGHYENAIIVNTGDTFSHRTLLLARNSPAIQNSATHGVTELGFRALLRELVQISDQKEVLEEAKVRYYGNARVGDRACYALEVTFLEQRPELTFSRMEVMVDKELDLPVRVAMYDWSDTPGVPGELQEEYVYVIKGMNLGLEDIDFCYLNSHYGFRDFVPRLSQREQDFMKAVLDNYMEKR